MNNFPTNTNIYNKKNTSKNIKPELIGYFSSDDSHKLLEDLSQLRYIVASPGPTHLDLKIGENEAVIWKDAIYEKPFLRYILKHSYIMEGIQESRMKNVGFVSGRTTLKTIAKIPYEFFEEFVIRAELLNGVIYINSLKNKSMEELQMKFPQSRWGHKFEQYVTRRNFIEERNVHESVVENEEFVCIFKIKLGENKILYRAELDGILANKAELQTEVTDDLDLDGTINELHKRIFAELKTVRKSIETIPNQRILRDTWVQSFYGVANKIMVGYRNDDGIVEDIQQYDLDEFKNMGKESWLPNVMLNFTDKFLSYIKTCFMQERLVINSRDIRNLPNMVKYFRKDARSSIIVKSSLPKGYEDACLPEWFINSNNNSIK